MHLLLLFALLLLVVPAVLMLLFGVFFLHSVGAVLTIPRQLWQMGRDRRTRRNHALEHATVNVLEERFGPQQIAGAARPDGFVLHSVPIPPDAVMQAAIEGWQRLSRGQRNLAIHPRCGTSMVTSTLLTSIVFLGVLFFGGKLTVASVLAVFVLAALLAKPIGLLMQRYVTTSTNVEGLSIDEVVPAMPSPMMLFGMLASGRTPAQDYFIRTHTAAETVQVKVRRVG